MNTPALPSAARARSGWTPLIMLGLSAVLVSFGALSLPQKGAPKGWKLKGNADQGAPLYTSHCALCHGPRGRADGPLAKTLKPPPVDLGDLCMMNLISDWELYVAVHDGGRAAGRSAQMSSWKDTLTEQQIHDVVAYVRTLARPLPDTICPNPESPVDGAPGQKKRKGPALCPRHASP